MQLAHGRFYGDYQRERRLREIALAELAPTVPESEVAPHVHADAHCLLLLAGEYISNAIGMPPLARGPLLIVNPPGTEHRDRFRGLEGRFFTVSLTAAHWRVMTAERQLSLVARRLEAGALAQAFGLRFELQHWDEHSPLAVECRLHALLDEAAIDMRLDSAHAPDWLMRVREQLEDQWRTQPGIAALAHTAGVHPVYLARAFRRHFGCTPADYLRRCRLQRAASLLSDSRRGISEIAADCGFVDHAHLTRAFQARYGCTPSMHRRRTS